jgi:hypothetical protein
MQAIERRYSIIGDFKMIWRMLSMSEILTDERAGDLGGVRLQSGAFSI